MATPRKKHFRVGDSILREPWPRELKLACVLLQAHLNTRWRRDGIPNEEAGRCYLSRGALFDITGLKRLRSGAALLAKLSQYVTIAVEIRGEYVFVDWPKFVEFQNFDTRSEGSKQAPDEPVPTPAPAPCTLSAREGKDPPARSPLLNLLTKYPGGEDEKQAWLEHNADLIEAEVDRELGENGDKRKRNGTLRSVAIRFYRQYSKAPTKEREFFGWAAKQRMNERVAAFLTRQKEQRPSPPDPQVEALFHD